MYPISIDKFSEEGKDKIYHKLAEAIESITVAIRPPSNRRERLLGVSSPPDSSASIRYYPQRDRNVSYYTPNSKVVGIKILYDIRSKEINFGVYIHTMQAKMYGAGDWPWFSRPELEGTIVGEADFEWRYDEMRQLESLDNLAAQKYKKLCEPYDRPIEARQEQEERIRAEKRKLDEEAKERFLRQQEASLLDKLKIK